MVFAPLDRAQNDKGRPTRLTVLLHRFGGQPRRPGPNRGRRGHGNPLSSCKVIERFKRVRAIGDHTGARCKHRPHPATVPLILSVPAKFRMGDRDQVMHQINRADVALSTPRSHAGYIKAGMTGVEPQASPPVETIAQVLATQQRKTNDIPAKPRSVPPSVIRLLQHLEQRLRGPHGKDRLPMALDDHSLRLGRVVIEPSEADTINPRRTRAGPATPDQPRYIQQQRRIVVVHDLYVQTSFATLLKEVRCVFRRGEPQGAETELLTAIRGSTVEAMMFTNCWNSEIGALAT